MHIGKRVSPAQSHVRSQNLRAVDGSPELSSYCRLRFTCSLRTRLTRDVSVKDFQKLLMKWMPCWRKAPSKNPRTFNRRRTPKTNPARQFRSSSLINPVNLTNPLYQNPMFMRVVSSVTGPAPREGVRAIFCLRTGSLLLAESHRISPVSTHSHQLSPQTPPALDSAG